MKIQNIFQKFQRTINLNYSFNETENMINSIIASSFNSASENQLFYGIKDENNFFNLKTTKDTFNICGLNCKINSIDKKFSSIVILPKISISSIVIFIIGVIIISLTLFFSSNFLFLLGYPLWIICMFLMMYSSYNDNINELNLFFNPLPKIDTEKKENNVIIEHKTKTKNKEKIDNIKIIKKVKKKYLDNLFVALRDESYKFNYSTKNMARLKKYNIEGQLFLEKCNYFIDKYVPGGSGIYKENNEFIVYTTLNKEKSIVFKSTNEEESMIKFIDFLKKDVCEKTGFSI